MSAGPGDDEPLVVRAAVEPRVHVEFPGLELRFTTAAVPSSRRSPRVLRERLRALSDRYVGARVVALRTQPIAHAYRAFFRQIGLDPDVTRVPSEEAAVARLLHGGFSSRDRVSDALLIALVETGVAVWALDASRVHTETLALRTSREGETLGSGRSAVPLAAGRLVVADAQRLHGLLFGALATDHRPETISDELVLFSVGVDGVPAIYLEEALWLAAELLGAG